MRLAFALIMALYLVADPSGAMDRAREAMALWAHSVAPALFPFMALIPALTDEYAMRAYERIFGRATEKCFRISARAASCVIVGLAAGSPAGAMAIERAYHAGALTKRECEIVSVLSTGAGPVFVISSVGEGMFMSALTGARMLICIWCSFFVTAFLFSRMRKGGQERGGAEGNKKTIRGAVSEAVIGILTVAGYMTVFSVFAGWLPEEIYAAFEISGGCMSASRRGDGALAAGIIAFGGLCAIAQNLSFLKKTGVRARVYVPVKAIEGVLSAALMKLTDFAPDYRLASCPDAYGLACMIAFILTAVVVFFALYGFIKARFDKTHMMHTR